PAGGRRVPVPALGGRALRLAEARRQKAHVVGGLGARQSTGSDLALQVRPHPRVVGRSFVQRSITRRALTRGRLRPLVLLVAFLHLFSYRRDRKNVACKRILQPAEGLVAAAAVNRVAAMVHVQRIGTLPVGTVARDAFGARPGELIVSVTVA